MRKVFSLLLFLTVVCASAYANHIKGGWIYYKYLGNAANGNLRYEVTIKVYRDCHTPTPGQNDDVITVTVYAGNNTSAFSVVNAPTVRFYSLEKSFFNPCIIDPPEICYVILHYQTTIEVPPNAQGYTLAFQRCCRISGIENVAPPTNEIGSTYTAFIPGTQNGNTFPQNNSAQFVEKDTAIICMGSSFELDYSATDPDGDSLSYAMTPAILGSNLGDPAPTVTPAPPYNSVSYTSPFSYANPFGTTFNINSSTGIISGIAPMQNGEYVVAVAATEYRQGKLVTVTRKELHIAVANCRLAAAKLNPVYINCKSTSISLANSTISPAIHAYYWDFGEAASPTNISTEAAPTHVYTDSGTYKVTLIVNKGEQCTDSTFAQVKIYPGFAPAFSFTGSCYLNPFNFSDNTSSRYGTVNSWRWLFGDNNTSNDFSILQNPAYTYLSPQNTTATLIAGDSKGCIDTTTQAVNIFDKPLLRLPFRDTLICSIDTLPLGAIGTGDFVWTTNLSNIILNNTSSTPLVFPKDTTVFVVTLTDRGCTNRDSIRVNVLDSITVSLPPDTIICKTDAIQLQPQSFGLQYQWQPAATLSNANIKSPTATPLDNTTYSVVARLGKCIANGSTTVRVVPYPQVLAGNDTSICINDTARLNGSIVATSFVWSPVNGLTNNSTLQPLAYPTTTTSYVLTARDTLGCPKPSHDTVVVTVIPPVPAFAGNDTSMVVGQQLHLDATGGSIYTWSPLNGLSNPNISNPVLTANAEFLEFMTYAVRVSTVEGCAASDSITVRIFKTQPEIFVPTAFTPNKDGRNDGIHPILAGIRQLNYFRIYNRWGELIFHTTDQNQKWDGTLSGKPQASGTFVYVADAVDYTGKPLQRKGTIVLIR